MTEKLPELPFIESFRPVLEERGFVEFSIKSIGGEEGLAELRKYASQNGYGHVSGTKTIFEVVNDDFLKEYVVCIYDPERIEKKTISFDEQDEDKRSHSASRVMESSSLCFPVLHSSSLKQTIWFERIEAKEELEERTA